MVLYMNEIVVPFSFVKTNLGWFLKIDTSKIDECYLAILISILNMILEAKRMGKNLDFMLPVSDEAIETIKVVVEKQLSIEDTESQDK